MLRLLPMGLFGAFLGALAERFDRRLTLAGMIGVLAATSAVLSLIAWTATLEVWHLAVASFINGIGWAADHPVRRMMIGHVIGLDRLNNAMSIEVAANQASRVAGPALGGILLASYGLTGCFVFNAALGVIAVVASFGLKYRNAPHHSAAGRLLSNIVEGLKAAHADVRLRGVLIVTIVANIFGWPCTSMIPVIAQDNLHLGTRAIGILASTDGFGALIGSLIIAFAARSKHYTPLYICGAAGTMAFMIAFALAPNTPLATIALTAMGLAGAAFTIMQATLVYSYIPPNMHGRILGLLSVCIGVGPFGFLLIGVLAEAIGAKGAVIATCLLGLASLVILRNQWLVLLQKRES
jgi:MFS family permease